MSADKTIAHPEKNLVADDEVGFGVGVLVESSVLLDGIVLGNSVVNDTDGLFVGSSDILLGDIGGSVIGFRDGFCVGLVVGLDVGIEDGLFVGLNVGSSVNLVVGDSVGFAEGCVCCK